MPRAGATDTVRQLDHAMPSTRDAQLGTTMKDMIDAHNDLRAQFVALLTHLDTGNVAGVGNGNLAAYGPTLPALVALGTRTIKA